MVEEELATYKVYVGTAKGLIIYDLDQEGNSLGEIIHFKGFNVSMVYNDPRNERLWVGVSHKHWGQKLHYSDDSGESWIEVSVPTYSGATMPDGSTDKLRQIWCMHHGGYDKPNHLWLGTEPGGLFHSSDNGESFSLVSGLWEHPSRKNQHEWFGTGGDHPFIHSIIVDPRDSDHVYVAVSCAGVFETRDSGNSWVPRNNGLVAAYLPNPSVEVGHDPHLLLMPESSPNVLWQQNHCGIFHSDDEAINWNEVSDKSVNAFYGFAIAIDDDDSGSAWVIPVESDEQRVAPDLKLEVLQTSNGGKSWEDASKGLPEGPVFDIVLRQAFKKVDDLFVFGTTNGNVYLSIRSQSDKLDWRKLSSHLTKVGIIDMKKL